LVNLTSLVGDDPGLHPLVHRAADNAPCDHKHMFNDYLSNNTRGPTSGHLSFMPIARGFSSFQDWANL